MSEVPKQGRSSPSRLAEKIVEALVDLGVARKILGAIGGARSSPLDRKTIRKAYEEIDRILAEHPIELRLDVARVEWFTACANHDLAKYGEWQCDWQEAVNPILSRFDLEGDEHDQQT